MRDKERPTMYIADLLNRKIVTTEGKKIGRVVDVQVSHDGEYKVLGLVFGWSAWLDRLHILHPFARVLGIDVEPKSVPWDAVKDFNQFVVTLKPGYKPKKQKT